MAKMKAVVHPVVNGFALLIAVAAVTIWSARLEHRVSGLEAAVRVLATTPVAGNAAGPAMSPEQACANLAVRVADAMQKPGGDVEVLRQLLRDAGCPAAPSSQK
jgi:hypothetical protein